MAAERPVQASARLSTVRVAVHPVNGSDGGFAGRVDLVGALLGEDQVRLALLVGVAVGGLVMMSTPGRWHPRSGAGRSR